MKDEDTESYDLSISDLMSALCCVFLLFLCVVSIQLNRQRAEYAKKNALAEQYAAMQASLYDSFNAEFTDLDKWNVDITPDLTFHFRDADVLFGKDSANLTAGFRKLLRDFFPRMVDVIMQDEYRDAILEIRIEGHTARNKAQRASDDYRTGMELSQQRTTNVLLYCLGSTIKDEEKRDWVRKHIAAIGYSNSIPVMSDGKADNTASRRVEIKIKTKAEAVLTDIRQLQYSGGAATPCW